MSTILDDPEMEAMAALLGMGKAGLEPLFQMPLSKSRPSLAAMKKALPAKFRDAAFDLHPDRHPDDPDAADKFKLLMRVRKILEEITVDGQPSGGDPSTYAEREREWVERARAERRRDRERKAAKDSPIQKPTKADVRSYGEPEDPPRKDAASDRFDEIYRRIKFGVGVSIPYPKTTIFDPI